MNKKVILVLVIIILTIATIGTMLFLGSTKNKQTSNEGKFAIEVKDTGENPVRGIKFHIYDENMQEVIAITTNSNGQAVAKNLLYGKYFYKEDGADKTESFELTENQKIVTIRMTRNVSEN